MPSLSRRDFLRAGTATAAVASLPAARTVSAAEPALIADFASQPQWRNLKPVLRAAANRIIPPFDNGRAGLVFEGAGEEGAVEYVELLLGAFDFDPPRIYPSAGPGHVLPGAADGRDTPGFSECEGGHVAVHQGWIPLPPEKELGWRGAIARFQQGYLVGLAQLDTDSRDLFGAPFVGLRPFQQTLLLEHYDGANFGARIEGVYTSGGGEAALRRTRSSGEDPRGYFFNLLFHHVMEAIYGDPVYRGAPPESRLGWKLAGFGGPRHPEGYFPSELETTAVCDRGMPANQRFFSNLVGDEP